MQRRGFLAAVATGAVGGTAGCARSDLGGDARGDSATDDTAPEWPSAPYAEYETTEVTVRSADGDALATVTAAIADTRDKRYLGLSDATALPDGAGMLFTYNTPRESLTYVMREMDFGIDIVYVDGDRTITRIHNAPEPGPDEDGSDQRYPGSGQYVLEVPYKWTDRNAVTVGDTLAFEL
ncbi:DUF192 domain-containing protein [Halorubrum sp. DTA46]|uniref:DUF192 domain-containing protein n=1 Tax=Halorubrum sp. DTA46 TaxID=3402162 RepID=UPI003AAA57C5